MCWTWFHPNVLPESLLRYRCFCPIVSWTFSQFFSFVVVTATMHLWPLIDRGWKCSHFETVWRLRWSWHVAPGMKTIRWAHCATSLLLGCWYAGLEDTSCTPALHAKDGSSRYIHVAMIWADINKYAPIGTIAGLIRDLWRVWITINLFMHKPCTYTSHSFHASHGSSLYIEC